MEKTAVARIALVASGAGGAAWELIGLGELVKWIIGIFVALLVSMTVFLVVLVSFIGSVFSNPLEAISTVFSIRAPTDATTIAGLMPIPEAQLRKMVEVENNNSCHLPGSILAGVARVESEFGANMKTSSAGAIGYGQFLIPTWISYGGMGNPYDFMDALPAMARYLCDNLKTESGREPIVNALWHYNHDMDYVQTVLTFALQYSIRYPELVVSNASVAIGTLDPNIPGGHHWEIRFGFAQHYSTPLSSGLAIHRGVDLAIAGAPNNGRGQPVLAFYPGVVAALTHDPDGGNGIIIWNEQLTLFFRYFHFDSVSVAQNQPVSNNTVIGILGASGSEGPRTGYSFPHLHFEVSRGINGDPVNNLIDPTPFMTWQVLLPQ